MRILQLTDLYPPHIGGLERHVANLSAELVRLGHEVTVAAVASPGLPGSETTTAGVRVERLPLSAARVPGAHGSAGSPFHPPAPDPHHAAALRRLVDELAPDVVHGHTWSTYSYAAAVPASAAPLVHTWHDYGQVCVLRTLQAPDGGACPGAGLRSCTGCAGGKLGTAKALASVGMLATTGLLWNRRVDRYVAISDAIARQCSVRAAGVDVEVIPTFVPDGLPELAAATPRPSWLPDRPYVLFVGALNRHKGVPVLLEAYTRLQARRSPGRLPDLVLLGSRHEDAGDLDQPGVHVRQDVPHAEVMAAWAGAEIGVVPSTWAEPLGQVAIEAALTGTPVVASRVGGLPEVVRDGETGDLVAPGDAAALADALDALLTDGARRVRYGQAAREHAARFTVSHVARRLERLFDDVVAAHQRHQGAWGTSSGAGRAGGRAPRA